MTNDRGQSFALAHVPGLFEAAVTTKEQQMNDETEKKKTEETEQEHVLMHLDVDGLDGQKAEENAK